MMDTVSLLSAYMCVKRDRYGKVRAGLYLLNRSSVYTQRHLVLSEPCDKECKP
jgi:hypothetical protein